MYDIATLAIKESLGNDHPVLKPWYIKVPNPFNKNTLADPKMSMRVKVINNWWGSISYSNGLGMVTFSTITNEVIY